MEMSLATIPDVFPNSRVLRVVWSQKILWTTMKIKIAIYAAKLISGPMNDDQIVMK